MGMEDADRGNRHEREAARRMARTHPGPEMMRLHRLARRIPGGFICTVGALVGFETTDTTGPPRVILPMMHPAALLRRMEEL